MGVDYAREYVTFVGLSDSWESRLLSCYFSFLFNETVAKYSKLTSFQFPLRNTFIVAFLYELEIFAWISQEDFCNFVFRMTIQLCCSMIVSEEYLIHYLSRMYDKRYRTPMRIARTDLVNFMIDDLVESSLGFLKRKKKKRTKKWEKCVILRHGIAFVLKSILCIINIVDCIVRGYILYIYIYGTREAITGNKTAGSNNCTIS